MEQIRGLEISDLEPVMKIWLDANIEAHRFIPEAYWQCHYEEVKGLLPQAEVYVYEEDGKIAGFLGLTENYIAGVFVKGSARSRGIGKQLLDYAKGIRQELSLSVYQKNSRAVRFYEREGFTVQSEHIDDETAEKEWIMKWR